ncbi:MAG: PAS domain S-box protein [Chloroflexi bacterium]|nr:MAG: PAS domain S-box protein [Chloroflexota bacterium]
MGEREGGHGTSTGPAIDPAGRGRPRGERQGRPARTDRALLDQPHVAAKSLELQRRFVDNLGALQALTGGGEAASGFERLAESIVGLVVASLEAVGGCYGAISTSGRFTISAGTNMAPEMVSLAESAPSAASLAAFRRLREAGGPFIQAFADETDRRLIGVARSLGYSSYAVLPIRLDDRLDAVIVAYFDRPVDELAIEQGTLDAIDRVATISVANFRLRERLLASEERYRTLFEESPEAYVFLDNAGLIVEANAAAERLFGTEHDGLAGMSLEAIHEAAPGSVAAIPGGRDAAAEVDEADGADGSDGRATRGTGRRADRTAFPDEVSVSRVTIRGAARRLVRVRDLTDQERFQQELVQAQKMEAIGMLVSGVAHELNNPLAAIIGFSTLLRRDERLPQDMRHDAEILLQEADRTQRIVRSLLDFARQRAPERHRTSVRALVDSVLRLQSYSIGAGHIEMRVAIPPDLPTIDVDRGQIQQVLLNLTQNAIQAIRGDGPRGWIEVAASAEVDRDGRPAVRLRITDSGPGIQPTVRPRVFLPFFTTKPPGEGTGLGLSVSFGIVAAHGGRLWFEPGPDDQGASFIVELPLDGLPARPAGEAASEGGAAPSGRSSERGPRRSPVPTAESSRAGTTAEPRSRILVLDDEPSIAAFLRKALGIAGFEPVVAGSGRDAVAAVGRERIDAVLCDHRMSGMSGTQVYAAITAVRPELGSRFVFMSGDVLNPELQAFAGERGVFLLAKPFDVDTVNRTIRDVLARNGSPAVPGAPDPQPG